MRGGDPRGVCGWRSSPEPFQRTVGAFQSGTQQLEPAAPQVVVAQVQLLQSGRGASEDRGQSSAALLREAAVVQPGSRTTKKDASPPLVPPPR